MNKVAIIGSIGVGKSTFLEKLSKRLKQLKENQEVKIYGEPSIIHGNLNDILLNKFYHNTEVWAYPLQSGISAAHEAIFTEIKQKEEKGSDSIFMVDAPFSSYIYCRIHRDAGRMTQEEVERIDNIIRPGFEFDLLIILKELPEITIQRIVKRSRGSEVSDFDYIHEHIAQYYLHMDSYIEKYMGNTEIVEIDRIPDFNEQEYTDIINKIAKKIMGMS